MARTLTLLIIALLAAEGYSAKVLKYSDIGTPRTFDPVRSGTAYANRIVTSVYDTLYEYKYLKRPFELKPNLAVGMPKVSKDGKTFTIKIKKGVFFIDDKAFKGGKGREVKASDFVYSIKRHFDRKNRSSGAWLWKGKIKGMDAWKKAGSDYSKTVEGLKALDDYTIQVLLTKSFPQFVYTLAMGFSAVVPKEAVDKYGREFAVHPVGSGPYKVISHNTKKTVLEKNKKFRAENLSLKKEGYSKKEHGKYGIEQLDGKALPIVDRIEVSWMKEPVARWNSFTKGNEIVNSTIANEQMDEVLASKKPITLRKSFSDKYFHKVSRESGLIYTHFNMDNKYLGYNKNPKKNENNRKLRCAIRKSINWPERIKRFYLGIGEAYPGFIPPAVDGFDDTLSKDSVTLDIEGAKKLLKQGGWTARNLPTLIYPGVSSVKTKQLFEQFRGNLAKIGYPKNKIKFKGYATFGDYNRDVKKSKTMLVGMGWGLDYPDAENTLALFYGPNGSPGSNSSNYSNPEYDKLFFKECKMQPSPERTKIYHKLNEILIDDCVTISAFSRTSVTLWHRAVTMVPEKNMIGNIFKYIDVK